MTQIQQKQLAALVGFQAIGHDQLRMQAGQQHTWLRLDYPQGVRFGHGADRIERLRDDAVNQRIDPNALRFQPRQESGMQVPVTRQLQNNIAQIGRAHV